MRSRCRTLSGSRLVLDRAFHSATRLSRSAQLRVARVCVGALTSAYGAVAFADGEGSELLVWMVLGVLATFGLGGALLCIGAQTIFTLALFEVLSRLRAARYRVSDTVLPRSAPLLDFCWLLSAPFGAALLVGLVAAFPDRVPDAFNGMAWVYGAFVAIPAFIALVGASTSRMIRSRAERKVAANDEQANAARPPFRLSSFICFVLMLAQLAAGVLVITRPETLPNARATSAAKAKARADAIEATKAERMLNADVKRAEQARAADATEMQRHLASKATQEDRLLQNGGQPQAAAAAPSQRSAPKTPLKPEAQAAADRAEAAQRLQCNLFGVFEVDKGNNTYWYTLRSDSTYQRVNRARSETVRGNWSFDSDKRILNLSNTDGPTQPEIERLVYANSRGLVTAVDTTSFQYKLVSVIETAGCDTTERLRDLSSGKP